MLVGEQFVGMCGGGVYFFQLYEWCVVLGDQDVIFVQVVLVGLVEVFGEQYFVRVDWVGGVGDDYVEVFFCGSYEVYVVVDYQVQLWVVEGVLGVVGQEFFVYVDYGVVDFDYGDLFDVFVFGYFVQYVIVVVVDDQYVLGCVVGEDWYVGEYFVVDEFVGFGGLDYFIECYYLVYLGVFENYQVLVFGVYFMQYVVDVEVLVVVLVQSFLIIVYGLGFFW